MGLGSESLITEVRDLLRGALVIPSIQRGYVWKRPQVPFLLDSLYRKYPVGSLLIWKTTLDVPLRMAAVLQDQQQQLQPAVLLDGQQRLTSLAKVFAQDKIIGPALDVRFDLDAEVFLNPSGAQRHNVRLLRVSELLGDAPQFATILARAGVTPDDADFDELYGRVRRVHAIRDTDVPVITVESDDYEEVAEIFSRVNQGGKRLSKGDLVFSAMAARWPAAPDTIERFSDELDRQNFALDREAIFRLTGVLAGTGAHAIKLIAKEMTGERLERAWLDTEKAVRYAVDFLRGECGIPRSAVLTSPNVVVMPALLLHTRNGTLSPADADALRRWVYTTMAFSHYSNQVEGKIDSEARLVRENRADLWDELLRRASGPRSVGAPIEPSDLAVRGQLSPYFNLLYVAALRNGAKDWLSNQKINDAPMTSTSKIEFHHVFPKAHVERRYGREITNSLANFAFISGTSNRKIGAKDPAQYLPGIPEERLTEQWIPLEAENWDVERFPAFLARRQLALAQELNGLLGLRAYVPGSEHDPDSEAPDDEGPTGIRFDSDDSDDSDETDETDETDEG